MLRPTLLLLFLCKSLLSLAQSDYWQQEVNYTIDVKLDDQKHELHGFETIEYINHSPDELSFIYMHLWPNAYKNDETAMAKQLYENGELDFYYSKNEDRGFIDSLNFKLNDVINAKWELDSIHIDIAKIYFDKPLKSGERITISTPFHVKIPLGIYSRLGHMGESYQITQWYPKPAVYDKNGWNQMPYLTQGEFYSEFGSFDVSITLPKNYVLGATGDMFEGEDELAWLEEKVALTKALTSYKDDMDFPTSSAETKTLRFKQKNVHDFAWFADKRYHVLKGEVELPQSKEKVTTWAMFTNAEADIWTKSIDYLNNSVYYYSLWNGDYPYKHCTAVDGALSAGAGMEYPNITVIGTSGNAFLLETVIMHEVGHNWFYGILGSNERMHPWMDEGLNSFNENRYIETNHPEMGIAGGVDANGLVKLFDISKHLHKEQYYAGYQIGARKDFDQPIELPSAEYTYSNYGTIVYGKSAISFDYLMAYLGEETMDNAMQRYFDTWKFKHPQPEDLKEILESESGKDLDWFFDDIINSTKKLDYKLVSAKPFKSIEGQYYEIKVKNTGDIDGPFSISGVQNDSVIISQWFEGTSSDTLVRIPYQGFDNLRIDHQLDIPETRRKNNSIKTRGLFRKMEPLRLQPIGSIENPDKTQLFFSPIVGWNNYDKAMVGLTFYNAFIPQKKFEYAIAPMYSVGGNKPVGSGFFNYNILPKSSLFRQISFGISGQHYHTQMTSLNETGFVKVTPHLDFYFKKKNARSTKSHALTLREITVAEANRTPGLSELPTIFIKHYGRLKYSFKNDKTLNPFRAKVVTDFTDDFARVMAEANFQFDFKKPRKEVKVRLFAGSFLFNNTVSPRYNFRMDGIKGFTDYTYDHVFLGRNEFSGILSQQMVMGHGGFKIPTPVGQSNKWLVAANIKADIPIGIPLGLFLDVGFGYQTTANLQYNFGVHVPLVEDVVEIYFPIFWSNDIQKAIDANGTKYVNMIRFTLQLEKVNPFQILRDFSF